MEHRFILQSLMTGLVCFSLVLSAFGGMAKRENRFANGFTISGTVVDARTGKPLNGANVQLTLSRTGVSSDNNGRFELLVSRNRTDTLVVSFIGYKSKKIPIIMPLKRPMVISLQPVVLPMPAVSVSGERFGREYRLFAMDPTVQRISPRDLKTTPFVLVPDLYRALQKLPGVTSNNETSPQLSVRGGNTDQNLVLIDGAPVYYPYHLLGLASAFNPDTFEEIYFSLGGFSAAYGGKLSSVLSLNTREPQKDFPHRINLSLVGGDITTGGKIGPNIGWLFSGRLCYLNLLNRLNIGFPYEFYDGLFKMDFQPGSRHKISFTVFRNADAFIFDDEDRIELSSATDLDKQKIDRIKSSRLQWTNDMYSLQWKALLSDSLFLSVQTFLSRYQNKYYQHYSLEMEEALDEKFYDSFLYQYDIIQESNRDFGGEINNSFADFTVRTGLEWEYRPSSLLRAGAEFSVFGMDYGWNGKIQDLDKEYNLFFDGATADFFDYDKTCRARSGYVENEMAFFGNTRLRVGIRISDWNFLKKPVSEPRINFKYGFRDRLSIFMACGRFSQGISTALEEGLVQFLELYFPVDTGTRIETADHLIAGVEYKIGQNLAWSVTRYKKKFQNLIRSVGPAPDLVQTGGRARGLEFMLSGKLFGYSGWVSYVLSTSDRHDRGRTYPTNFDRRHHVSVNMKKELRTGWTFSVYWELHSGQPYDPYTLYSFLPAHGEASHVGVGAQFGEIATYYVPYEMDIPRGYIRYPWYHRLDISISKIIYSKKFTLVPYVSIYNVYNRENVLFYRQPVCENDWVNDMPVNYRIVREAESVPFLPAIGVRMGF